MVLCSKNDPEKQLARATLVKGAIQIIYDILPKGGGGGVNKVSHYHFLLLKSKVLMLLEEKVVIENKIRLEKTHPF